MNDLSPDVASRLAPCAAPDVSGRGILDVLPAAVYTTDASGRITSFNRAATELWGRVPVLDDDHWCGSWKLFSPDGTGLRHEDCPMGVALREGRSISGAEAVAMRPDGVLVPFLAYPTVLRDGAGRVTGAVNMLVDITERKRAEIRQKALLDELNHRVKNTLSTVQSLAAHTFRDDNATAPAARAAFEGRLFALSRVHDQLSHGSWESTAMQGMFERVCGPYLEAAGEAVTTEGEALNLAPRTALGLAMVFHELATNAVKYGALSVSTGRLSVSWTVAGIGDERRLRIAWIESGGPEIRQSQIQEQTRPGFGLRFIERSIRGELRGIAAIEFARHGLRCAIDVPLPC